MRGPGGVPGGGGSIRTPWVVVNRRAVRSQIQAEQVGAVGEIHRTVLMDGRVAGTRIDHDFGVHRFRVESEQASSGGGVHQAVGRVVLQGGGPAPDVAVIDAGRDLADHLSLADVVLEEGALIGHTPQSAVVVESEGVNYLGTVDDHISVHQLGRPAVPDEQFGVTVGRVAVDPTVDGGAAIDESALVGQGGHAVFGYHIAMRLMGAGEWVEANERPAAFAVVRDGPGYDPWAGGDHGRRDRKSTRLNSSHVAISY